MRLLLAHGAGVDARADNGWTPLFAALAGASRHHGNVEAVALLVQSGADVTARDRAGMGLLWMAKTQRLAEASRLLERAGATD
jgi:ankyrin repeat protein